MSDAATPIYTPKLSSTVARSPIPPWRIKGILPTQGLATIYGPSTAGKSFLAIDIAASIALGNDWFGFRVRQCNVMYVALEGEGGFPKRLRAWEQFNECKLPDELLFIIGEPFEINNPVHVAQLATVIKRGSVIIIDTLNRSAPDSDENASRDMGLVLAGCKQLQRLTGGLVILIHHTGKDIDRGMRGHSSLHAAVDASIEVNRDNDTRSWNVSKAKDGGDGTELFFKLVVEHLGEDEDGDSVTSCAVEPTTEVAKPKPLQGPVTVIKGNQKLVLAAILPLLVDGPISWDEALQAAIKALESSVDSRHRADRSRTALQGLVNIGRLSFDGTDVSRP